MTQQQTKLGTATHPGPWTWEEHELSEGRSCIVYDARGDRVMTDHEGRETAALIASAPKLLDALEAAERCLDILAKTNMQSRDDAMKLRDLASSRLDGIRTLKIVRAALYAARAGEG